MEDRLQEWIKDASAYELLNTYRIEQQSLYSFTNNSEDFYISLLNRMFFTIRDKKIDFESKKERLLQIVKGLLVYSEETTADKFEGVNRNNNLLYISAIYYLCQYNALSKLFISRARQYDYENESSQLLFSIMAGSSKYANRRAPSCELLMGYMSSGDESLLDRIEGWINHKVDTNDYLNLDDFFDTHITLAVLEQFRNSNLWRILNPYGGKEIWGDYIAYSVRGNIFSLLPSQEDAILKGLLKYTRSFSLKMPTSAGKTFLTELLVYQEFKKNPDAKILYLAPLRSLSRELKDRYARLSHEFHFDFRAAYGGCTTSAEEESIERAQLLIATPETFITLEGTIEDLIGKYTLVICDEGQLLEDKSRGVNYELLLTRLKRNAGTRFLFISAIIPNISDINKWLGGQDTEVGDSRYRPCKIRFAYARPSSNNVSIQYANDDMDEWFVKVDNFLNDGQAALLGTSQKSLSCAIALKAIEAGPVMLFCSMKDGNRGCISHSEEVLEMLKKHVFKIPSSFLKDKMWLDKVIEYFTYQLGAEYRLTRCIQEGFAYHHGQMPQDLRELIEMLIAKKSLQLIVCTKTLSEGVNMPIKTAILANVTNPADGTFKHSLELRDLKNIVGRVGRAGKESYGLVIVPSTSKNNEPAENVLKVLLDRENVERANGALYYVVRQIIEKNLTDDGKINSFLEETGVAESIDMLINLNREGIELDEINLDGVLEDSLAHYLGDEKTKQSIKKVFTIRYDYLKDQLPQAEYGKYLQIGLPLADYNALKRNLSGKTAEDFAIENACDNEWIHLMMGTIYSLGSVVREVSSVSKSKPLYDIHKNLAVAERIVLCWLEGKQYVEIAEVCGCSVEQAALYVDFIQKVVAVKAQSIVAFIENVYEIESPLMMLWPEMLKRGVHSQRALWLIDSGLGDRAVVNMVDAYFEDEALVVEDRDIFIDEVTHRASVDDYVMNSNIPIILKERWKSFLRSKGIL